MAQDQIIEPDRTRRAKARTRAYSDVRRRFGGIDTAAALGGMLAAIGTLVILGAALAAVAIPFDINLVGPDGEIAQLGAVGTTIATVLVLTSFLVGGWAAARIARFDGVINGVGVALWMLLLLALSAAVGLFLDSRYNIMQRTGLPDWFSQLRGEDVSTLAIVAAVLGVAALVIGSVLGGAAGESYNRKVNAAMVETDPETSDDPELREWSASHN